MAKQMSKVPVKTKSAFVRFTPEQYIAIEQRAEQCGLRASAWMRGVLLQAANKKSRAGGGYLRIVEPNGKMG